MPPENRRVQSLQNPQFFVGNQIERSLIFTVLPFLMNAKLMKQRFWSDHENGVIKTIPTIPHNLYESFKSDSLYAGPR